MKENLLCLSIAVALMAVWVGLIYYVTDASQYEKVSECESWSEVALYEKGSGRTLYEADGKTLKEKGE